MDYLCTRWAAEAEHPKTQLSRMQVKHGTSHRRMLTAESTLPPVQHSSSPFPRTSDAQHASSGPAISHASVASSSGGSLQHPLHCHQPYPCTPSADQAVTCASSEKNLHSSRCAHPAFGAGHDVQLDLHNQRSGVVDADSRMRIRASSCGAQRHTNDGAMPRAEPCTRQASAHSICRQTASVSVVLPTRQQQLAAISRLRKPLAVVTQKNSLIRYTQDGRRYWRWKDVVARVLHICRGASADDYSLLLQTEHWLEACDSKHRYGSNLKPYFKQWLQSDTHQSFFKWLDEGAGLHVDIKERPRSKLDADRVVYCGIERCFFEVTIVQGWFRYGISKRLVTTDSTLDQPPCPPNLGETMNSIRSQMLPQLRTQSPPLRVQTPVPASTPPMSPAALVAPVSGAPQPRTAPAPTSASDSADVQAQGVGDACTALACAVSTENIPEYGGTRAAESVFVSAPVATSAQGASVAIVAPTSTAAARESRVSVDAASNGSLTSRRPGLLTQEFCRAAGMPYAQGGDSMRGSDMAQADVPGDHSEAPALPFLSSPPSPAHLPLPGRGSDTAALLVSSKSGSVLPGADAAAAQAVTFAPPGHEHSYPYLTDDRFAGGWLDGSGHLCMRRHGVNSMPSGLVHLPSLASPSGRLFSRDVGGSDDEDSDGLVYGRSVDGSSAATSPGSSPVFSSPQPPCRGSMMTPIARSATTTCASVPHASIHGFPSMPRLGVHSPMQQPMLRPPKRTLRFPSSSITPEAQLSCTGKGGGNTQPDDSEAHALPSLQRMFRSAEIPAVRRDTSTACTPVCVLHHSSSQTGSASRVLKHASPNGQCRGWDILRESLRMRRLAKVVSCSASAGSSGSRKHAQRRMRAPMESRVADVTHPRLVSNSAIPENLKLLDIVETVAAPGGSRVSAQKSAQATSTGQQANNEQQAEGDDAARGGGDVEVRDLADVLEERMLNTGQLVKVKTQAQLEEMLPCAPKVLSKDSGIGKRAGVASQKHLALMPVSEYSMDRTGGVPDPGPVVQGELAAEAMSSRPDDRFNSVKKAGEAARTKEAVELRASRDAVTHGPLAQAKDGTAVLEKAREKWIYVWDMHSRLYINRKMPGRFHHSSFVAGGAVKAAGSIVVEDGVLKQLTTWSGHYRPRASDIALFLQWLESNHVDMTNVELLLVKPNKPNSKMNKTV